MTLSAYSAIIWDWNGTLIDDLNLIMELVGEQFRANNLPAITVEVYRKHYQHPMINMYTALGMEISEEDYPAFASKWVAEYERRRKECQLHRGVTEILTTLSSKRVRQTILSAHKHDLVAEALNDFDLGHHFESYMGLQAAGGHSKIDNGRLMIEQLGVNPATVLMVGDSCHDFEVAQAIGVDCHLLAQGCDAEDKLQATGQPVFATLYDWGKAQEIL